jgi:hypothetical protein
VLAALAALASSLVSIGEGGAWALRFLTSGLGTARVMTYVSDISVT